jgi:putative endonuclease
VGYDKQRRLTDLALRFLKKHKLLDRRARFDVVAVTWSNEQSAPTIEHFPNAFEATGRFQMFS